MLKKILVMSLASLFIFTGCTTSAKADSEENTKTPETDSSQLLQTQMPKKGDEIAIVTTNMGVMKIMFFPEQAPKAVENFKTHSKQGYYDGLTFHRVLKDFMIQGGDPTGTGAGGESIWGEPFEDEFSPELHNFRGALSMANSGANTNGSQFFIVQADTVPEEYVDSIQKEKVSDNQPVFETPKGTLKLSDIFTDDILNHYKEVGGAIHLDYVFGSVHTVFGQVYEGLDIVDKIADVKVSQEGKPESDVIIEKIEIVNYEG